MDKPMSMNYFGIERNICNKIFFFPKSWTILI